MVINDLNIGRTVDEEHLVRSMIVQFFWSWYLQHSDDVLLEKKFLWFSVKIRLIDIESLFVKLFGPRPSTVV